MTYFSYQYFETQKSISNYLIWFTNYIENNIDHHPSILGFSFPGFFVRLTFPVILGAYFQ